jgi:hypothetical protein
MLHEGMGAAVRIGPLNVIYFTEFISRREAMQAILHVRICLSWATRYTAEMICQELQSQRCSGEVAVDVEGRRQYHFVW